MSRIFYLNYYKVSQSPYHTNITLSECRINYNTNPNPYSYKGLKKIDCDIIYNDILKKLFEKKN